MYTCVCMCVSMYVDVSLLLKCITLDFDLCLDQACHTKAEYEEYGATICRIYPVFKGYVGVQVLLFKSIDFCVGTYT